MRQLIQNRQTTNTPGRRVGNLLMIAGVATPIVGIVVTKFVPFEFDIYRRVIQSIFIAGLLVVVAGILVKNYWKGTKPVEKYDPSNLWSNPDRVNLEEKFDWTGVGCSLLALGPGIFFILGFLFAGDFQYAAVIGFASVAICTIVGNKLYGLGKARRAELSEARAAATLGTDRYAAHAGDNPRSSDKSLPQISPLSVPEGFVLVDASEGVTCGIPFLGIFSAVWYVGTFFFMFLVWKFGGEDTGKGMLILSLFLLAGLMPVFFLIRLVRMASAFEKRAELVLPHWPLEPGEEVEMSFHCDLKKPLTATALNVILECQKVDHSGSERDRTTEDTRSVSVRDFKQQDKRVTGKWRMGMPTTWTLPYKMDSAELSWKVNVVVELAEGPKGAFNFELLVVRP